MSASIESDPKRVQESRANFEAAAALTAVANLTEEQAKDVVRAIVLRKVPRVRISY